MYTKAKEGEHFFGLIEVMLNPTTITTAIHRIKGNKGSYTSGIDKQTIKDFLNMPYDEVFRIVKDTIINYKPKPVRRVFIPKRDSNKLRPLGIPVIIDRLIQELTKMVIEPILEAQFFEHSYGFRPFRSAKDALARIHHLITFTGTTIAIEGDIESFFDKVDHSRLLQILWSMGIRDKRILTLIRKMLDSGIMENNSFTNSVEGTTQGGIISPLLANAYLHSLDMYIAKLWWKHPKIANYKRETDGVRKLKAKGFRPIHIVRYADDFVILINDHQFAELVKKKVERFLKYKLKLTLSKEKTLVTDITKRPMKFLGWCSIAGNKKGRRTNKKLPWSFPDRKRLKNSCKNVRLEIRKIKYAKDELARVEIIEKVNSMIIGIANYYALNYRDLRTIDWEIYITIRNTLCRVLKVSFNTLYTEHQIPAKETTNRRNRHETYSSKLFYLEHKNCKIGFTKAIFNKPNRIFQFSQKLTPYTKEGRDLYMKQKKKKLPQHRPSLTDIDEVVRIMRNVHPKYNLDIVLNIG